MNTKYNIALLTALQLLFGFGFSVINGNLAIVANLLLTTIIVLISAKSKMISFTQREFKIIIPLVLLLIWHSRDANFAGLLATFLQSLSLCVIVGFKWDVLIEIKKVFLKLFATISAISLFFWVLYLLGISVFPSYKMDFSEVYVLKNHMVFIETEDHLFRRFQCLFVEPGMYGILCVISLIINDFKKDKKSLFFILSALFSLSLSTYLLLTLVFVYRLIVFYKTRLYKIALIIASFIGMYVLVINYNNGDNVINEAIFFRLQLDENNKMMTYNRNTEDLENFYDRKVTGGVMFSGIGSEKYKAMHFDDSVDIKAYITLDGLIGLSLLLLFYFLTLKYAGINKTTVLLVGVFLVVFYRGFVFTFTYGGLLLFLTSILANSNNSTIKKLNISCNEHTICPSK